ncbi:MAG: hypothetical protein LC105_11440 [Chitinophagales bacterium]|nr:hypothetical protein [Chitinophagales bacterium]MCZ2394463.1 hypothetical protein [Chitinophagales bacterium]
MKVYDVPNDIQPLVSTFLVEANKRGHRLVIDDLIITYKYNIVTAKIHAAGLCRKRYGHTPIIFIDTTSPNWRASDISKEQLVFHELCHCILNRGHNPDTLMNGNFASIMKPSGETIYGAVLNYFKREYYLDELFNPAADKPAWAQVTESYLKPYQVLDTLFYDDFENFHQDDTIVDDQQLRIDSVKYKDWSLGANSVVRRWVVDGHLELESYERGTYTIPFNVNIPDSVDFEIKTNMVIPGGNSGMMSFYWGGSSLKDMYAIIVNQDGYTSIGQVSHGVVVAKSDVNIYNDVYNEIVIRKSGAFYYIFINGRLIDNLKFEGLKGNLFGFGVSGLASEVWIDDVLVTIIQSAQYL